MKISLWLGAMFLFGCSVQPVTNKDKQEMAGHVKNRASFLPENDYGSRIQYQAGEVTEQDFNEVLDAIREIYEPIFGRFGQTLVVNGDWSDNTINAFADKDGGTWNVSFFGGLARQAAMTRNGFALVACHEIGHHIAGFPFYQGEDMANEGQSDYYATASCARKIFDKNSPFWIWGKDLMKPKPTPNPDQQSCNTWGLDKQVCQVTLDAGLSLGKVLAALANDKVPSYSTPDKTVVKKTSDSHPKAQCRVDTYKVGALCNKEWDDTGIPQNKSEANGRSCDKPRCWYAP